MKVAVEENRYKRSMELEKTDSRCRMTVTEQSKDVENIRTKQSDRARTEAE